MTENSTYTRHSVFRRAFDSTLGVAGACESAYMLSRQDVW